jgi:hypothetical protein
MPLVVACKRVPAKSHPENSLFQWVWAAGDPVVLPSAGSFATRQEGVRGKKYESLIYSPSGGARASRMVFLNSIN